MCLLLQCFAQLRLSRTQVCISFKILGRLSSAGSGFGLCKALGSEAWDIQGGTWLKRSAYNGTEQRRRQNRSLQMLTGPGLIEKGFFQGS